MDKIVIGKVLKPQGLKGEMKVGPLTDNIEQYNKLKTVYIGGEEFTITHVSIRGGFVYLRVEDIDDCNQVEILRNKLIERDKESNTNENGDYYIVDLEKCTVVDENGVEYGKVTEIEEYGAAPIITIVGRKGQFSFPYIEDLIVDVDIDNKKIVVDSKRYKDIVI